MSKFDLHDYLKARRDYGQDEKKRTLQLSKEQLDYLMKLVNADICQEQCK